jgi:outer membrane beta-barrel protein
MNRLVFALAALLVPAAVAAQELDITPPAVALQNREYSMSFEIDAVPLGSIPLDPFYKGYYFGGGAVIHFTDYIGWQVARGAYSLNATTQLRDQLERDFGQLPTAFDEVNWFAGSDLMIKPFYGKSSVMNSFVLHYEAFFILGGTVLGFSNSGLAGGVNLGGGLRLFITKWFSLRVDITDTLVIRVRPSVNVAQVMALQLATAFNIGGWD